jgi:predicted ATP-dependent serine protease
MNSMDFANIRFKTLGFKGKWRDLIGDPSSNFTAMVFGKPKFGKSTLCVDFAGYLARNHGKVLYVAKEEGLDRTLQDKLNDKNVKHPNLDVASVLPESLTAYDFIFLDSVNRLGLSPEDLRRLKAFYPTNSFIYVFQTTKQGNFRGANSFQHDVDVVIEVPEKGKAVQMGRFNQGGEMEIFEKRLAV